MLQNAFIQTLGMPAKETGTGTVFGAAVVSTTT